MSDRTSASQASPAAPWLSGRFDRILIVKPSSLGDVIHALPVLNGLRHRFPQARIDWLVSSSFRSLLDGHPMIDEVIGFDRRRFSRVGRSIGETGEFLRFARDLRARRYDLVLDLQGLFRTGFLTRVTAACARIGFRDAREGAWIFYNHHLPRRSSGMHAVDRYYLAAPVLGFQNVPIHFPLPLAESPRSEVRAILEQSGYVPSQALVIVAAGARWKTKEWSEARVSSVVDAVQSRGDARCVLVGGPDEAERGRRIAGSAVNRPINLVGRTTIPQLAALIEMADAVLCHDSAAAHLAVALDRPLVCLIGPTHPGRTGPYRRPDDVIRRELPCSPCYFRKLSQCPHDHRCMSEITVEEVVDALRRRLPQPPLRATADHPAKEPISPGSTTQGRSR